jgi:hypothetical protein
LKQILSQNNANFTSVNANHFKEENMLRRQPSAQQVIKISRLIVKGALLEKLSGILAIPGQLMRNHCKKNK